MSLESCLIAAALSVGLLIGLPQLAEAHAHLKSASPAPDGTVAASPPEIRILFTEGIEPKFTGLTLTDKSGKAVATGTGVTDPQDNKTLIVPVSATLAPGAYKVHWHAVAVDTHKTEGDFTFTVAP